MSQDNLKSGRTAANDESELLEEAADRYLSFDDGSMTDDEYIALVSWLEQSEERRKIFKDFASTADALTTLGDRLPWPSRRELQEDHYNPNKPVTFPRNRVRNSSGARRGLVMASNWLQSQVMRVLVAFRRPQAIVSVLGAIVIAAMVFTFTPQYDASFHKRYSTDIGEHRSVTLPDDTEIHLGAGTQISVTIDRSGRRVDVRNGEALFVVAHDPDHEFIVSAGNGIARAVGTSFNVHVGSNEVSVTVLEGIVEIETLWHGTSPQTFVQSLRLTQNEQGKYDNSGMVDKERIDDVETVVAWQEGKLVFVDESLENVIADINRYSPTRVIIGDMATSELLFSGTYYEGRVDYWLTAIERAFPVRILRRSHQVVIYKSNENATSKEPAD